MNDSRLNVLWLFRAKRNLGNFSIENSFAEMLRSWESNSLPTWTESKHFSQGLFPRCRIIQETAKIQTEILHITGDIHFAALAWPKWKRTRPKVILTIHDIGFIQELAGSKKWLMRKFWIEWPLRCVDHLITVSEATKKAVLAEAPWFPKSRISVIPTVVPQHFRRREQIPQNSKPVALHVGLAANKNLQRHAQALQYLEIHLRIIGEPSSTDIQMLQQFDIEYSCASRLSDNEMQAEYAHADFLLFASTLEGFGMPIIEAQMVGLPVITSDIEPMNEVAGEGALLCNPFDHRSIRNAIEIVTSDNNVCKRIADAGVLNAKRFDPKHTARQHQELYNKLLHD